MIYLKENISKALIIIILSLIIIPARAQSLEVLGKLMAKQVEEIRGSNSATLITGTSNNDNDDDTNSLIAGIPRPQSQSQSNNIIMNKEYYSDFVGPIGAGKVFVPICNPKSTISDVKKYMSAPNVKEDNETGTLYFVLYADATQDDESALATYHYFFMNGTFRGVLITFLNRVNRDKCLAWMVKNYKYESSNVEGGMDMHKFTSKDKKVDINVNFMNFNEQGTAATINYLINL